MQEVVWGFVLEGAKSIVGAIVGAVVGALIKGWIDRKAKLELKNEIRRYKTEVEQNTKTLALKEKSLGDTKDALDRAKAELATRENVVDTHEKKIEDLLKSIQSSDTALWSSKEPAYPYADYADRIARRPIPGSAKARPLIMVLVNYKGGVGKTTTTANLAAYFDRLGKRVLLVDLDYQGSLTTVLRTATGLAERQAKVNLLFGREATAHTLWHAMDSLAPRLPRSYLVQSFYELARLEEQLMIEWLVDRSRDDMRFRLARSLLDDEVMSKIDVVLIDAPPRLTTATVNALCASTHVLIPTIMNTISSEPVLNFLRQTTALTNRLNPRLGYLGVVETMAPPSNQGQNARGSVIDELMAALRSEFPQVAVLNAAIPRRQVLSDGSLSYLTNAEVRGIFDKLGNEIVNRVGGV